MKTASVPMNRFSPSSRTLRSLALIGIVSIGLAGLGMAGEGEQQIPPDKAPLQSEKPPQSETPVEAPTAVPAQPETPRESEAPIQSETATEPESTEKPETPVKPETAAEPATAEKPETGPAVSSSDVNPFIMLKGLVWRAKPGIVFLKTPFGLLSLSSKTTLKSLPASQEVSFWIHEDYMAIDIVKRTDRTLVHRYLTGPFKRSSEDSTKLMLWTPEGEQAFQMGSYEQALLARRDGNSVTVEVDHTKAVIGVHDLQFDLQIGQSGTSGSHAQLLLTGTISKLKSNFIFFRTPIGIVNVNAKIGIKNAKVGQIMTLHMHDQHVVADLAAPNDSAPLRRFVTGPLKFATPDRTSLTFWTPEGEQTYPTDVGKASLNGARDGSPITVELNGEGHVVDIHRLK
jgi:hypothetical protein